MPLVSVGVWFDDNMHSGPPLLPDRFRRVRVPELTRAHIPAQLADFELSDIDASVFVSTQTNSQLALSSVSSPTRRSPVRWRDINPTEIWLTEPVPGAGILSLGNDEELLGGGALRRLRPRGTHRNTGHYHLYPERYPDLPEELAPCLYPVEPRRLPVPRRVAPAHIPAHLEPWEFRLVISWDSWTTLPTRGPSLRRHVESRPLVSVPQSAWSLIDQPTGLTAADVAGGSLAALTAYYYVVTAYTTAGETDASNEATDTTTAVNLSIQLDWNAVSGATGYRIYRGTASGGPYGKIGDTTSLTFTDDGTVTAGNAPPTTNTAGLNTDWEITTHEWQGSAAPIRAPRRVSQHTMYARPLDSDYLGPLPAVFVYSPASPTRLIPRRLPATDGTLRDLPDSTEAIQVAWHGQLPQPPTRQPRPVAVPAEPFGRTVWFDSLQVEELLAWLGPPVRQPARTLPRLPAPEPSVFHAWMPVGDPMAWYVPPQPRRLARPVPTAHEYTASPPWYSSGATITVAGPYWVVAGAIYCAGAAAGTVVTE